MKKSDFKPINNKKLEIYRNSINLSGFIDNKKSAKQNKKMLKNINFSKTPKKQHKVLKMVSASLVMLVGGYFIYNQVKTDLYNKVPPIKDPHTTEGVLDSNNKDFELDENGQIVLDKIEENEKQTMLESLLNLFLNDANNRLDKKIEKVTDLISLSLMPYNLCNEDNEYDKYCLSALISDGKDIYAVNYLTGKDFESDAEFDKDYFMDFVNYLNTECAIDVCHKMSDKNLAIKNLLDENVIFVGDSYLGYKESGDEYYFIPVYNKNGQGTAYGAWASPLDAFDKDPMDQLFQELSTGEKENFTSTPFNKSNSLDKIFKIYNEKLKVEKTNNSNKKNNEKDMTK